MGRAVIITEELKISIRRDVKRMKTRDVYRKYKISPQTVRSIINEPQPKEIPDKNNFVDNKTNWLI